MPLARRRLALLGAALASCLVIQSSSYAAAGTPVAARPVTVTNTVATTDDANPYSVALSFSLTNGSGSASFVVPTGKRLVIDYLSARTVVYTLGAAASLGIGSISNGQQLQAFPAMENIGTIDGATFYALGSNVKIFADANTTVTAFLLSASPTGGAVIGIYGHLVPLPG
jgi:hypothetical protein